MIDSLFGELGPRPWPGSHGGTGTAAAGAATVLTPALDVLVEQSPAAAMRQHFAARRARGDDDAAQRITLIDPSRLWAPQVIQALSDAAARPVERLNLRERTTLRTLAVIERATVPRHGAATLKVAHAEMRVQGLVDEEIGHALAESSALTAVIVGAMQPHALLALLRAMQAATDAPGWRCPWLVFVLPPGAAALGQRIINQSWPAGVRALAVTENDGSPAGVWNCVLGAWEATQDLAPPPPDPLPRVIHAADAAREPAPPAAARQHVGLPAGTTLARLLGPLARTDGVLACGIVDLASGDLLASDSGSSGSAAPADLAGLAVALCAARQAHVAVAPGEDEPDEVLITAGPWQTLLRRLPGQPQLGFAALIERGHANLALLRFRLLAESGG